jgi:uncharacterized membrane-anchored protein
LKPAWRILAMAALCIAGLIALVVRESAARASGAEILLAMEAVDPRALLQGHYVSIVLRESISKDEPCPPTTASPAPDGWVALRAGAGGVYHAAGGSGVREEAAQHGPIVVRGGIACDQPFGAIGALVGQQRIVSLDLGINAFYIAQSEAQRIERVLSEQNVAEQARVYAIVSAGQDGRARLKGLMVDGERLELGWD